MYNEDDTPPRAGTAARARYDGEKLNLPGDALDLFVKAGAHARHQARVAEARECLIREASRIICSRPEGPPVGGDCRETWAIAIVLGLLDGVGIGGRFGAGLGCASTTRLSCLRALGKGRRQASDGNAWTSAIRQAVFGLANEIGANKVRPSVHDEYRWAVYTTETVYNFNLPDDAYTRPWEHAAAKRAILLLGGYEVRPYDWTIMDPLLEDAQAWQVMMNETKPKIEPLPEVVQESRRYVADDDPNKGDDAEIIRRYTGDEEEEEVS